MARKPKVALVLGAGSARGLAHIGVLQVLLENQIPLDLIVGSSMGAMVGAIYACGADIYMLDKMVECMNTRILFDVGVPRLGFIAGHRITEFLNLLTKKKNFADLDLPVAVVATDLVSGQRLVITEGQVTEAVRASISLPGIFAPVQKDGMVLVDGAVSDRLPIEVAHELGADLVLAVDVTFGPGKKTTIDNTMDVILTSLDIMAKHHFDTVLTGADILIQPEVGQIDPQAFERSREAVDMGRKATEAKIEEIRNLLKAFNDTD
ncbi:MAG: patatin-like phospholipase family protein [Syntrophomonadaceae bacterium]|nr:patatin-like phospholipase family protein [Syntrophomonadaceae bacterium]